MTVTPQAENSLHDGLGVKGRLSVFNLFRRRCETIYNEIRVMLSGKLVPLLEHYPKNATRIVMGDARDLLTKCPYRADGFS